MSVVGDRVLAGVARHVRRGVVLGTCASLAALGLTALSASTAAADTAPNLPTTLTTVTADALPTVQVNGVVWSQVVVGNTVYVTGSFSSARPAGAAAGTNETPRANLLAYDIRTGELNTTWAPTLNAQGMTITASEDGSRIFVGGDFTSVSGVAKNRIVALDATTGAVIKPFAASANARVRVLVSSGSVLYAGGQFTTTTGVARSRAAAFDLTTGALLTWAPVADAEVMAMTAPAGSGRIILGGRFAKVNGVTSRGSAAVDAATGATLSWPVNGTIYSYGTNAAIWSLSNDGSRVFGTAYNYGGTGNLENTFAADVNGNLIWASGCHGDTYSSFPQNGVLYEVGHAHNCSAIGAFPETSPSTYHRALAYSVGAGTHGETNVTDWQAGQPAPELLTWWPEVDRGTVTGQNQGGWTITGNGQYIVMGGEFPRVNYVAQAGLARFAVKDLATNKQGPTTPTELTPTVTQTNTGALRVSWKTTWDRDNQRVRYEVLRNGSVIGTISADSVFWNRPTAAYTDTTFPTGTSVSYQIRAKDATNTITGASTTVTTPGTAVAASPYANAVRADGAIQYWPLGEKSGSTAYNWDRGNDLTLSGTTRGAAGAIAGSTDTATTFKALTGVPGASTEAAWGPNYFAEEAWFRTTSTTGGEIIGFGSSRTGDSSSYDRMLYLGNDGKLNFGVYPGTARLVTSPASYNDGNWHHVVANLGGDGMQLYVDGALVGSRADTTYGQMYSGYWRIGGDKLAGWPNQPTRQRFNGDLDEVAVYPAPLGATTVQNHHALGTAANQTPKASFTSTLNALTVSVDASASTDPDGTIASYAWNFGDGATGTGATATHAYAAAGTYQVTLTVTDDKGATNTSTASVSPAANQLPTASFTSTTKDLTASFDASASTDPDGTIASYDWDFGDSAKGTGATVSHTYAAAGTYPVTVTVTDNSGGTATKAGQVTVTAVPAGTTFAADTFTRTVASGWGTADTGGAWTGGSTTASVADGSGRVSVAAGATSTVRLPNARTAGADLTTTLWAESLPTGGGVYASTIARATAGGDYRAKLRITSAGAVQLSLTKVVGGTETEIAPATTVSGITYTAGAKLNLRVQTVGTAPTTVQARVWADGSAEPTTWQRSATDSTAELQTAGAIGQVTYLSGSATAPVVVRYDGLTGTQL